MKRDDFLVVVQFWEPLSHLDRFRHGPEEGFRRTGMDSDRKVGLLKGAFPAGTENEVA